MKSSLHIRFVTCFAMSFVLCSCLNASDEGEIKPSELLTIASSDSIPDIGQALHAPNWKSPEPGDIFGGAEWQVRNLTTPGEFDDPAMAGGLVLWKVESSESKVMMLQASGDYYAYTNGRPRVGDFYKNGIRRTPVLLHEGENDLYFSLARGSSTFSLSEPQAPTYLDSIDATLPDFHFDDPMDLWGGITLVNATTEWREKLTITASAEGMSPVETTVDLFPPLHAGKITVRLFDESQWPDSAPEEVVITLTLSDGDGVLSTLPVSLPTRRKMDKHRRTYVSQVDGSVQYFAVLPATDPDAQALALTLHGASVEAMGQVSAYAPKPWITLVAPTNRRPFGFDWEDWGRTDALDVLNIAQRDLNVDPRQTYLTGHSMGGHGTWIIGTLFPDRFAAIAPSAGWISFDSYAGGRNSGAGLLADYQKRSSSASDTLGHLTNLLGTSIYTLHGDADDNVPVSQARRMRRELDVIGHTDVRGHEQPGAGHWWDDSKEIGASCVDWPEIFQLFASRIIPKTEAILSIDFKTANPGVTSKSYWLTIEQQEIPLEISHVSLGLEPHRLRIEGTTENVHAMTLDVSHLKAGDFTLIIDEQELKDIATPEDGQLRLRKEDGTWALGYSVGPSEKNPTRMGPFKAAFDNRFLYIVPTRGTEEENAWGLDKARYDSEQWWYRGNGVLEIIRDIDFNPRRHADRSLILLGNADTNAAWPLLLADCPIQVTRESVTVGENSWTSANLCASFIWPRLDSEKAMVAAIGGTTTSAAREFDLGRYFTSGAGYPDYQVLTADQRGLQVHAVGFYDNNWRVSDDDQFGEFKPE